MNQFQRALKLKELALEGLSAGEDERYRQILEIAEDMLDIRKLSEADGHDAIYASIIHKLAQEYFRIFYVDIRTGDFLTYDPYSEDPTLDTEHVDRDFFMESKESRKAFDTLVEADKDTFFADFSKEKILRSIDETGEFSILYRVRHQDSWFFANMRGTRIEGDHDHIIVGVKNIDEDVRREKEYLINLAQARDEANRDGLTGIRNRHAYLEFVTELAEQLASGDTVDYAIVVFDVNGLKMINDTLGHQAGDRYIREACRIICDIFKRSPVFRIGGDEFVVVARGDDYANLDHMLDQVELLNRRNGAVGGIVIAAGMARANGEKDIRTVFELADARMYENKKRLKLQDSGVFGKD